MSTIIRPFFALPRELQLAILDYLPTWDYVVFSLVSYSLLRPIYPDYFPAVTRSRLRMMRTGPAAGTRDLLGVLPNEMVINIARNLDNRHLMRWVFAHYHTFASTNPPLVPPLDLVNSVQLYKAWIDEGGG